jgi:spore coat polysaccharide biosynthesis protein SpsF
MKTLAIIQARMGATRLPDKVLADIHGRPMLGWLLERVRAVAAIDEIVVATTAQPADDILVAWLAAHERGVGCFRGSESDVLERFYRCAEGRGSDVIVRITADDPLKDPGIIGEAIEMCRQDPSLDYVSNTMHPTWPEGLDIEVFRTRALQRAFREATLPSEREHVTPYIWKNPQKFRVHSMEWTRDLSHWRWTVDKPADLEFMRQVFGRFIDCPLVPFAEVIAYLEQHPQVREINAGTIRNEGYLKSLSMEKQ